MAFTGVFYNTDLPSDVIQVLCEDIKKFDKDRLNATVGVPGDGGGVVDHRIRNSQNIWLSTDHWIVGFLWHYVMKANRENFMYDLTHIDSETVQYTFYDEGMFYNWHTDSSLSSWETPFKEKLSDDEKIANHHLQECDKIRKLSFVLQLSDPFDYQGGQLELLDDWDNRHLAPRAQGTLIVFDSRMKHRVTKIKKGHRQSIVGWVMGPRWK